MLKSKDKLKCPKVSVLFGKRVSTFTLDCRSNMLDKNFRLTTKIVEIEQVISKLIEGALAGVAQWIECWPEN